MNPRDVSVIEASLNDRRRQLRRRRRLVAIASVGLGFAATSGAFLASSAVSSPVVSVAPGTPSDGLLADVTNMSPSVVNGQGLQVGVALAKLTTASADLNQMRVEVDWTSASIAAQVLHNPNIQISVGIYHPIHLGACNVTTASTLEPIVSVTDGSTYCLALDESATGTAVSSSGKELLSHNQVGGFVAPQETSSGTLLTCATSVANETINDPWCQPSTVTNASQRVLYVVASIVTPGGVPQGQQPTLNTMGFFIGVRR